MTSQSAERIGGWLLAPLAWLLVALLSAIGILWKVLHRERVDTALSQNTILRQVKPPFSCKLHIETHNIYYITSPIFFQEKRKKH